MLKVDYSILKLSSLRYTIKYYIQFNSSKFLIQGQTITYWGLPRPVLVVGGLWMPAELSCQNHHLFLQLEPPLHWCGWWHPQPQWTGWRDRDRTWCFLWYPDIRFFKAFPEYSVRNSEHLPWPPQSFCSSFGESHFPQLHQVSLTFNNLCPAFWRHERKKRAERHRKNILSPQMFSDDGGNAKEAVSQLFSYWYCVFAQKMCCTNFSIQLPQQYNRLCFHKCPPTWQKRPCNSLSMVPLKINCFKSIYTCCICTCTVHR